MSELLHHAVDAKGVLQHVHALCVGVVAHRERTLDGLRKLPNVGEEGHRREDMSVMHQTMTAMTEGHALQNDNDNNVL